MVHLKLSVQGQRNASLKKMGCASNLITARANHHSLQKRWMLFLLLKFAHQISTSFNWRQTTQKTYAVLNGQKKNTEHFLVLPS